MSYKVKNRYGVYHYFSNRRKAERYARDERRDGWPCKVEVCT